MSYFKEYDKIKKVYNEFEDKKAKLNEELENAKDAVYPDQESKKAAIEDKKKEIAKTRRNYNQKLDNAYQQKQEEIKSLSSYGEGNAQETAAELAPHMLEDQSKTDIKIMAEKYQEQNNYKALNRLKSLMINGKIPMVDIGEVPDIEKELQQLEDYYSGKLRAMQSNDDWLNRMMKVGDRA